MLKHLCVLLALALVQCVYTYDPNLNCISGPSYWCKSIQNSKECNAFKHCTQTVWTKHEKYLTKSELVDSQSGTPNKCSNCIQCLSTDLRRCAYVNLYRNEITDLLLSKLSASSICTLMRQCETDKEINQLVESEQHVEVNSHSSQADSVDDFLLTNDFRFKCGMHPRNWCDSLKITRRCHAFDYCLVGWSRSGVKYEAKPIIDEKNKNMDSKEVTSQKTCGFCIFVFNKLQSVIQQNATQVEVKEYLEGACNLLPTQNEVKTCLSAIDSYYTEIYNMVRNNIDPGIICRVLEACQDKFLIPIEQKNQLEQDDLTMYKNLASNLKQIKFKVLNEKEAVIKTPLQNKKKVDTDKLLSQLDSQTYNLKATSGIACELCTIVLNAAKYMIQNKVEEEKILGFIEHEMCARLGAYNSTCVEYVNAEGAIILELLAKAVDPSIVCRTMGLCLRVQVSDEFVNENFFDLNVRNPLNCTLCKMVIQQVKQMIGDNKKQAEIIQYIDTNLCAKVGKTKELCKSLIDAYGPLFLEIVARDVNPSQLCSMIGMCESCEMPIDSISFIDLKKAQKPKRNDLVAANQTCVLCEFVLNVLTRYINQNSTEPEIEKWLQYVCTAFPSSIKGECSAFIDQYGSIIVSLLIREVQPDKICQSINLCPRQKDFVYMISKINSFHDGEHALKYKNQEMTSQKMTQTTGEYHDISCTVCQFSMEYLNHQYNLEQTEKNIEFAIQNVCSLTPIAYRHHCNSMVNTYGARLIEIMRKYSDSLEVCKQIKLCKASESSKDLKRDTKSLVEPKTDLVDLMPPRQVKTKKVFFDNQKQSNAKNGSIECQLCIYAAELVQGKLKENKTDVQIVEELKLICNLFPTSLKDQCVAFINEYGPYVVQLVVSDLDPKSACAALKLCDEGIP